LQKSSFVSEDKVDRSNAEVDVIEAEIDAIESIINRRTIKAPFDGVIGIHRFEVGQYLDNNTALTALVGDNGEMWVDFSLPQFYGELTMGSVVAVSIVRADALGTSVPLTAEVVAGDATINAAARSRLYRAVVREGAGQLLDNMSVTIAVPLGLGTALMSVPSVALRSDSAGEFVWVLDGDASGYRARRQAVTSYGQEGDLSYVDTVTTTDLVATAGAFKLSPGLLVKTVALPTAGAGSGAE
jgi:membrane fusion protein, multidrug efflux system